jgi:dTDP-4-dehydrorhamnose reductase
MNVLILGKGFVGNALKKEMPDAFIVSKQELNYFDEMTLISYLCEKRIKLVINCSGYTGNPNVDACENDKENCYKQNVELVRSLQRSCVGVKIIHVSSGCIYDGYEKVFTEEDIPNFGMFSDKSSFYSKTKHIAETIISKTLDDIAVVRLRIPFDYVSSRKNYFNKLLGYNNLIDFRNSKTDLRYLCRFIHKLADNFTPGIFNAVHSNALTTQQVLDIMVEYDLYNPDWKIVDYKDIPIKANRSNCVLSNQKARVWGFDFGDEEVAIREALKNFKI